MVSRFDSIIRPLIHLGSDLVHNDENAFSNYRRNRQEARAGNPYAGRQHDRARAMRHMQPLPQTQQSGFGQSGYQNSPYYGYSQQPQFVYPGPPPPFQTAPQNARPAQRFYPQYVPRTPNGYAMHAPTVPDTHTGYRNISTYPPAATQDYSSGRHPVPPIPTTPPANRSNGHTSTPTSRDNSAVNRNAVPPEVTPADNRPRVPERRRSSSIETQLRATETILARIEHQLGLVNSGSLDASQLQLTLGKLAGDALRLPSHIDNLAILEHVNAVKLTLIRHATNFSDATQCQKLLARQHIVPRGLSGAEAEYNQQISDAWCERLKTMAYKNVVEIVPILKANLIVLPTTTRIYTLARLMTAFNNTRGIPVENLSPIACEFATILRRTANIEEYPTTQGLAQDALRVFVNSASRHQIKTMSEPNRLEFLNAALYIGLVAPPESEEAKQAYVKKYEDLLMTQPGNNPLYNNQRARVANTLLAWFSYISDQHFPAVSAMAEIPGTNAGFDTWAQDE